ncbi:MAG: YedE family putative selenium transporter [Tissierellales bacterium]|jgi:YedE family putative selenium metabolism protein|nr:YedE family putative selenium transporter [Tissierellales bacterium]
MHNKKGIILTGSIVGLIAVLLVKFGNPANMGFCIACFIRDIAGATGFHRAAVVQYLRPEIIGLVLGAFIASKISGEFSSKGGSSPFTRLILGALVMIGALMFLGCPLRMVLRIAGGDLNAIIGLFGFIAGILVGVKVLEKGFTLKRNYKQPKLEGYAFPIFNLFLFAVFLMVPSLFIFSSKGPGALAAPIWIALVCGLIVGFLSQKSRLCMVGGTRDMIMFKDNYLLLGFLSVIVVAMIGNIAFGFFNLGFDSQPVAHSDALWNFLGMAVVGWASVLLGGCPLRQLILAGEGNSDSAITVAGLFIGAGICHNFGLASSPKGPTFNGQIAVAICFIILLLLSYINSNAFGRNDS